MLVALPNTRRFSINFYFNKVCDKQNPLPSACYYSTTRQVSNSDMLDYHQAKRK